MFTTLNIPLMPSRLCHQILPGSVRPEIDARIAADVLVPDRADQFTRLIRTRNTATAQERLIVPTSPIKTLIESHDLAPMAATAWTVDAHRPCPLY